MSVALSHLMIDDPDAMEDFGRIAAMLDMFPSVEEILEGKTDKAPSKDVIISIGYAIAATAAFELKCEHERLMREHGVILPPAVLKAFQQRIENLMEFVLKSMHPELFEMIARQMIIVDRLPIDANLPCFTQFAEAYAKQLIK